MANQNAESLATDVLAVHIDEGISGEVTDQCIHEYFEWQAATRPEAPALIHKSELVTYSDLNEQAARLAKFLRKRGVRPECLVGLMMDRSPDAVVAIMAILKAGGACVPLDPNYPARRIKDILDDTKLKVVVTVARFAPRIDDSFIDVLCVDLINAEIANESVTPIRSNVLPQNIAFVTYTSASTGKAKGVLIPHRAIMNGLNALPFDDRPEEVCALQSPLSVAFTWSRLFLPLARGASVFIVPEGEGKDLLQLVSLLESGKVTSIAFATPVLRQILNAGSSLTSRLGALRTIVVGGSRINRELIEDTFRALPNVKLFSGYASTEVGGAAMVKTFTANASFDDVVSFPPFPNTKIHILDDGLNAMDDGDPGEIYIEASHMSRGYLADASLTAERFMPNPFTSSGERFYRTGDLGRRVTDGSIEILGRVDDQVKVRGFRVVLGEVEAVLQDHKDVKEAAVAAQEHGADKRLVGYVVPRSTGQLSVAGLRQYLAARLPEHLIPSVFVTMPSLPLTDLGKVDRLALPRPADTRINLDVPYQAPRNPVEAALVEMWGEILKQDEIGVFDNFVELGGDSLLASLVVLRIKDRFGKPITQRTVLLQTLEEIAAALSQP